jgi:hypothetical protein
MYRHQGKYCVIRCRDAGVHVGVIVDRIGREVVLAQSRRLHYYDAAFTLSRVAVSGPGPGSRVAVEIPGEIELLDACEVLPCTLEAEQILRDYPVWIGSRETRRKYAEDRS